MCEFAGFFVIRCGGDIFARLVNFCLLIAGDGRLQADFRFQRGEFLFGDVERKLPMTVRWYRTETEWLQRVRTGAYREYYTRQYGGPG